jgi:dipeptidyl aminopeptidase/acylaminoacyl peptidase
MTETSTPLVGTRRRETTRLRHRAFSSILLLLVALPQRAMEIRKRPITVEDCVRTRRIVEQELQISPDGAQVAFIVKAPNLDTKRNDYQLRIRDLDQTDRLDNGRLLLVADRLSGIRWLGSGRVAIRVERNGGGQQSGESEIDFITASTGAIEKLNLPARIEDYSISADGGLVVFSTLVSHDDRPAVVSRDREKIRQEQGYRVVFGEGRGREDDQFPEYEVYVARRALSGDFESTKLSFSGPGNLPRRSLLRYVQGLNLSPDGKYLLVTLSVESLPAGWGEHPLIQQLKSFGTQAESRVLGVCELATTQLRIGFNYPGALLVETRWADDSRKFSVVSPSPLGTAEAEKEVKEAEAFGSIYFYMYRFNHVFEVDPETGAVTTILNRDTGKPGYPTFLFDGPLAWRRSAGQIIVRSGNHSFARMTNRRGRWEQSGEINFTEEGRAESSFVSDGRVLLAISQAPTTPPDISMLDLRTRQTSVLTDLNTEYRNVQLGETETMEWTNRYGAKCSGLLIKPVDYEEGKRYPLIFMATNFGNVFISDTPATTAFAPQSLANAGFLVLMSKYPGEIKLPKDVFPGDMGDAFNWMDMVESAVDVLAARGMADENNLGIVGFSRTSWLTDFTLTHSSYHFRAASSADSGIYTYGAYFRQNLIQGMRGDETQVGGPPYGDTLRYWLEYAPPFNAEKVAAAVLMEYRDVAEHGNEFFVALSRLSKPVELYCYPKGGHPLDTPSERVASLQRNVDWFRFWMQGYERPHPEDADQYVRWRAMRSRDNAISKGCREDTHERSRLEMPNLPRIPFCSNRSPSSIVSQEQLMGLEAHGPPAP